MKKKNSKYNCHPFKLMENRVWRTYTGGKLLEIWQGKQRPRYSEFPEEWVASVVQARNTGREHIVEGLSNVKLDNTKTLVLKDMIEKQPEAFLGCKHVKKYGCNTGLLVKVLNSRERLTIQVHPDKEFALKEFGSEFGKTESWYILGGERIDGEDPYVLLGFKPGITQKKWKQLFKEQDIQGMLDSLHKIPVEKGDVYLLEAGVPHAIGSGCFLVEVQEPTDYTFRTEKITPTGNNVPDMLCHQGVGFDKMLNCFHYNGYSLNETLNLWKIKPKIINRSSKYIETSMVHEKYTSCFVVNKLKIKKSMEYICPDTFFVSVILSGKGRLLFDNRHINIKQADELFIPALVNRLLWENKGETSLDILLCFPPK